MARYWLRFWAVSLTILTMEVAGVVVGPLCTTAHAQQSASAGGQSWTDSITSPIKQGFSKVGKTLNPKPSARTPGPEDDAISLKNNAKPGPELYLAVARLYEQSGKLDQAEEQYQLAQKASPNDPVVLLGYAHLKESSGKPDQAIEIYQRLAKAHPEQASVHNNLALCYARQNRLDDAVLAMGRAVQADPKNPLYRNNLATLFVDQGRWREAFAQLRAVHGNAAAYYNLGYLLNKKGQSREARQYFEMALQADPSMDAARRWVEYLQRTTTQARAPQHPASTAMKITSPPSVSRENVPMPPDDAAPQRLPPTMLRQSPSDSSTLSGGSYDRAAAPMPPPSMNTALRPLPRVN